MKFLSFLKVLANHDLLLKSHLLQPRMRNATYDSPTTQNQIIDVIGKQMIQKSNVQEVKFKPNFFFIMVDKITSFNKEYYYAMIMCSIC